jgi:LmbE family N-acetylglucosaminyl deacetylase
MTIPTDARFPLHLLARPDLTLMGVWAHPDDESYLAGGLMAAVAAAGGRVINVSATAGERGDDPAGRSPGAIASGRTGELRSAMTELGVAEVELLGLPDGGCAEVPGSRGERQIDELLARYEPDVVVTFGDDGITGHADHRAVSRWTAAAVEHRSTVGLLTATSRWFPRPAVEVLADLGAYEPGYPRSSATDDDVLLELTPWLLERKSDALARHATQTGVVREALGEQRFRSMVGLEGFVVANPAGRELLADTVEAVAS